MNVLRCTRLAYVSVLFLLLLSLLLTFPDVSQALSVVPLGDYDNVTVLEVAGDFSALDAAGQVNAAPRQAIAREFYRNHGDDYDFLVLFTGFNFAMPPGASAYYLPVRNSIEGIGLEAFDQSHLYAANGAFLDRFAGFIDMGPAANHVLEPTDPRFEKTLLTLTHEMLHRWGAYVRFMDDGQPSDALLGLANAHWSFLLDADGSSLYGNHWRDNLDGTFTTVPPEQGQSGAFLGRILSPLELYLMGLAERHQVPSLRLIDSPGIDRSRLPEVGVTIPGTLREIGIDQIIAAEGERFPTADVSREFRVAFIYAVAPGAWNPEDPTALRRLAELQTLQREWETRFAILTDGTARLKTQFVIRETVESNPGLEEIAVNPVVVPSVSRGVDWLVSRKGADGFWQDQPGTAVRDTATAVRALKPFPAGDASALSGETWLSAATPENHDFLARTLLAQTQGDTAGLIAAQNSDGGWGGGPGYRSNPVDTALALRALGARGGVNNVVIDAAVNYLHGTQSPDGGWNISHGASMVQPTAYALLALNGYRDNSVYTLEPTVADGMNWLLARQNGDGGFGNSPSTVYDTAIALSALKATGAAQANTGSAINYLLATQADSGSWYGSVFQTALAVEALYAGQVVADLTITSTDIAFTPALLDHVPADVTLSATVRNLGVSAATQVDVALYAGDPSPGNLLARKPVDVPGNGSGLVDFTVTVTATGLHRFHVVIDEGDHLAEGNEWNNAAGKVFAVNVPPPAVGFDLAASSGAESLTNIDLAVSLAYPWPEPITVSYSVNPASSAVPGGDYLLAAGALTFAPDETVRTISLIIVNDSVAEIDKTLIVDLTGPSSGSLAVSRHIYTIRDDEPPAVTISSPPAGVVGTGAPQLLYSSTGGSVVIRVDGAVVDKVSGDNLDPLTDGLHTIEVTSSNSLGLSTTVRVDFAIDTTLPTVVIHAPVGLQTVNMPLLDYSLGDVEMVEVMVDGVVVNKTSGQTLDPLGEGSHTVTVTATNAAGRSNAVTASFLVDTIPPQVMIRYPVQDGVIKENNPRLLYELGETGTVAVTIDGVPVSKASGENLDPLADGEHVLRVSLTDGNGVSGFAEIPFVIYSGADEPYVLRLSKNVSARKAAIAFDDQGNIYITGSNDAYDIFINKYTYYGELLWARTFVASGTEYVEALAVDSQGNAYVTGYTLGALPPFTNRGGTDSFVVKYDTHGNRVWVNQFGTPYTDDAYGIAIDDNDNLVVSGMTGGYLFGSFDGSWQFFVAKLNRETGQFYWGRQFASGTTARYAYLDSGEVTFDALGNIYLAGNTEVDGNSDYMLWKMDSNGGYQWFHKGTSTSDEMVFGLGVDAFGNVILSGNKFVISANFRFAAKIDSSGNLVWEKTFGGTGYDNFTSVVVEGDGDFYLAGGGFNVIKVDSDGNELWNVDPAAFGDAFDVAMDRYRNLYVVGGSGVSFASFCRLGDPRSPAVTFDKYTLWVNGETASVSGTASSNATVQVGFHHEALVSDAIATEPGRWRATLSGFGEGENHVSAVARNAAGFKDWAHAKARVDAIAPVVTIESPGNGAVLSTKPVLDYTVSEGQVTVFVNGVATYKQSGATIDALRAGMNTVRVEAVDLAGNVAFAEIEISAEGAAVGELPFLLERQTQYGTSGVETVEEVVSDVFGNVYVFGYTTGSFPGYQNAGNKDLFVSKYDGNGSHLSTWQFGQSADEFDGGIAVDDMGNIYVAWTAMYTNLKGKNSTDLVVYVAKIDLNGSMLWQQEFNSSAYDYVSDVVVDADGNVYVAGKTYGSIDRQKFGGIRDYFVAKLSNDGNKIWTRLSNYPDDVSLNALAVDANGNLYATGYTGGSLFGVSMPNHLFLIKFVNDGYKDWVVPVVLPANNYESLAINTDDHGNIFVAGDSATFEYFVAKYAATGAHLWTETSPSTQMAHFAGMNPDKEGNVFLSGYVFGSFDGNQWAGGEDVFLAKHAATGEKLWSVQLGSDQRDFAGGHTITREGDVFVAGYTYGQLGEKQYGSSDIFLAKFTLARPPATPDLTVNPYPAAINTTQATITGHVSTGAGVDVVILAPVGSAATLSPVALYTDGTWSFTVSNLVANADNVLSINATDDAGTTTESIAITVDTLPPALTIDPVDSPISQNSQTLTGSVENGATLTVEVNPPSLPVTVPAASGSWGYEATSFASGDNVFTFSAIDSVGNTSSRTVTITYVPPPPLSLAVNPTFIAENEGADISLFITNVAPLGAVVTVEQVLDLNQNGVADVGDPLVRRFTVTDGAAVGNPNLAVDSDGLIDGAITVLLNAWFANDRYHAAGQYVYTARTATDSDSEVFSVVEAPQPQNLSGVVLASPSLPVSGALVELRDVWGRSYGFAMTDAAGQYRFNVEWPGDYLPVPFAPGYAYDRTAAQVVTVSGGQAAVRDLTLLPGTYQVSGKVLDAATMAGLPGVLVHAESSQYLAQAMTAADGSYSLTLPDGNYDLMIEARPGDGLASQGYAATSVPQRVIQVNGNLVGQDLPAVQGTSLICGAVSDAVGRGAAGVPVRAYDTQGGDSYAETISDGQGEYCVMLASGGSWQLALNDGLTYGARMVGTLAAPVDPNLTIYPIDGWVGGTVSDESAQPVAGLWVEVGHVSGAGAAVKTTADGRYLLGLSTEPAGEWSVVVHGEALGYEPLSPEWVAPITSQTLVRDFSLVEVQQPANSIVVTNASYHSKKKTLTVYATSDHGVDAVLDLEGVGPMTWNSRQSRWELVVSGVTVKPESVTVAGPEGSVTVPVN